MLNEGFAWILAEWFWSTAISFSLTYGSPEASCIKQANTYFGKQGATLIKEFWTLCILLMTKQLSYKQSHIRILALHIVCRFVKWLWDLDPTFSWPISLDGEISGGSVLRFPQNVLWRSSYCQKWHLRIWCEDSTKEGRYIEIKQVMPLLHLAHHLASLSRSLCRYSASQLMFLVTAHWLASSANFDKHLVCHWHR